MNTPIEPTENTPKPKPPKPTAQPSRDSKRNMPLANHPGLMALRSTLK